MLFKYNIFIYNNVCVHKFLRFSSTDTYVTLDNYR